MPIRLCYMGNTFINHSSYQGRLKENTQMGAELLGVDSVEADAEMIAMVIDGSEKEPVWKIFRSVSVMWISFRDCMDATGFEEEELDAVDRTDHTTGTILAWMRLWKPASVRGSVRDAFRILPKLTGDVDVLEQAADIAPTVNAGLAIEHLKKDV